MKWEPILNDAGKKTAAGKLKEISDILLDDGDLFEKDSVGLLTGRGGIALFLFYYARYAHSTACRNRAVEILSESFDILAGVHDSHSYASGLAGVGWLVEHLVRSDFLDASTDELLVEVDPVLYRLMIEEIKAGHYDFLHDATGHAVYFLSRLFNPRAKGYLEHFVDELEKISITDQGGGIKWRDSFSMGSDKKVIYNLGMAHGIPALAVFLGKMVTRGIAGEKSLRLLNGAVEYILNQFLDRGQYGCYFPTRLVEGERPGHSRMGWCYGDPGAAMALWLVSQAAGREDWEKKAMEILLFGTKRRDAGAESVLDAGLCHGAAGIAHIYNRIFFSSGIAAFKETAEYWIEQVFKMAAFEDGLAGYKRRVSNKKGTWVNSAGVLDGIAGIGMALIAAISDIEPKWDECLLLS